LGLDFILKLKTASYNYIEDKNKRRRDGMIAQDVQAIMLELGVPFSGLVEDGDAQKTLNLAYADFVMPLINAVKEQQIQIEKLKKENIAYKSDVELLKSSVAEIKASLKNELENRKLSDK
jgi:trimeric autotransporter adhesin